MTSLGRVSLVKRGARIEPRDTAAAAPRLSNPGPMFGSSLPFLALETRPAAARSSHAVEVKGLSAVLPDSPLRGCDMTEDEVAILESDAIQAVRRAFDAIEEVASGRMSREEARELFDLSLTAHELAATARAALPSGRRHRWSGSTTHSSH